MGKIWLKSTDPNKQCCGCEGKSGPCDSCCTIMTGFSGINLYTGTFLRNKVLKSCPSGNPPPLITTGYLASLSNISTGSLSFLHSGFLAKAVGLNPDASQKSGALGYVDEFITTAQFETPPLFGRTLIGGYNTPSLFQYELTINEGEFVKIGGRIQNQFRDYLYRDRSWYQTSNDQRWTGFAEGHIQYGAADTNLAGDYKRFSSGGRQMEEFYSFNASVTESGGYYPLSTATPFYGYLSGQGYLNPDPAFPWSFGCSCVPIVLSQLISITGGFTITDQGNGYRIYEVDPTPSAPLGLIFVSLYHIEDGSSSLGFELDNRGSTSAPTSISVVGNATSSDTIYPLYYQYAFNGSTLGNFYGGCCSAITPPVFFNHTPSGLGNSGYLKFEVQNVKRITRSIDGHDPFISIVTPLRSACVNYTSYTDGTLEIFNGSGAPLPVSGRLRSYSIYTGG